MHIRPALFVGYPVALCVGIFSRQKPVFALCPFNNHPRQSRSGVLIERGIQLFGFIATKADFDIDTALFQHLNATAR